MDNGIQMPSVQPTSYAPNDNMNNQPNTLGGQMTQPMQPMQPNPAPKPEKKDNSGLIKTIIIVVVSLIAVTFIGLFIWIMVKYNNVSNDVDSQITEAVAEANKAKDEEWAKELIEQEQNPFLDFSGPIDYGQLSFKHPKNWSVYVASDATKGGDYAAYFNPGIVYMVSDTTVNALRVTIRNEDVAKVQSEYQRFVEDASLKMDITTINGVTANRYTGIIPHTEMRGIIVIFKIRDKTAIMQTDSMTFESLFNQVLESVTFNV